MHQFKGIVGAVMIASACFAANPEVLFYVSPTGNDAWSGTKATTSGNDGPFATIERARDAVRTVPSKGTKSITVYLRDGTYVINNTISFTKEDSGAPGAPVVYAAYPNETPVISGGSVISGWRDGGNGLWVAEVPKDCAGKLHQMFVDGHRRVRARTPNLGQTVNASTFVVQGQLTSDDKARFRFRPGDIKRAWADSQEVEIINLNEWQLLRMYITGVNEAARTVTLSRKRMPNSWALDSLYWVENTFDALDVPGEWYYNKKDAKVYYQPMPGEKITTFSAIGSRLLTLIKFNGTVGNPVHDITFRGLTFSYSDWAMPENGFIDNQAGTYLLEAAVMADAAHAFTFDHCTFAHLGQHALHFGNGSKGNSVTHCEFADIGGGGVYIGEKASEVHPNMNGRERPLSGKPRYPKRGNDRIMRDYPKTDAETPSGNIIADNRIHDLGLTFPCCVGLWIGQSCSNLISHNEICNTYYSGISCGWTWGFGPTGAHDNIIEYNHIHDIMRNMLSDGGGVYTLGRQPGTVIRYNLIHDIHHTDTARGYNAFGVYLDSATSEVRVENNVIYNFDDGGVNKNSGESDFTVNNIIAFGRYSMNQCTFTAYQLEWTFERNIIYRDQGDLLRFVDQTTARRDKLAFDHNLYFDVQRNPFLIGHSGKRGNAEVENILPGTVARNRLPPGGGQITWEAWRQAGQDAHSIIADPKFKDPQHGDFSLASDSPASRIGFKPIDLSTVGPRK